MMVQSMRNGVRFGAVVAVACLVGSLVSAPPLAAGNPARQRARTVQETTARLIEHLKRAAAPRSPTHSSPEGRSSSDQALARCAIRSCADLTSDMVFLLPDEIVFPIPHAEAVAVLHGISVVAFVRIARLLDSNAAALGPETVGQVAGALKALTSFLETLPEDAAQIDLQLVCDQVVEKLKAIREAAADPGRLRRS